MAEEREKPLEAAATAFASECAKQLSGALKESATAWLPSLWERIKQKWRVATASEFQSVAMLQKAVAEGNVGDGDAVLVNCRPTPFGPFLRNLFLTPITMQPKNYTGPVPLIGGPMNILAAFSTTLLPVGLYPPMQNGVVQGCIYPVDELACGFLGLNPMLTKQVARVPAIFRQQDQMLFGRRCSVRGTIRFVGRDVLHDFGCTAEQYEQLRQNGQVWFLDAAGDEGLCKPMQDDDGKILPLWGGLYASGHLEFTGGDLPQILAIQAFEQAMTEVGFGATSRSQNQVHGKEWLISARGIRCQVSGIHPIFALHMDVNLFGELQSSRAMFDAVCTRSLSLIADACKSRVKLGNPGDLDFTYSNSESAHSVMRSMAAEKIADPIAIAVRDWNRRRATKDAE